MNINTYVNLHYVNNSLGDNIIYNLMYIYVYMNTEINFSKKKKKQMKYLHHVCVYTMYIHDVNNSFT